MIGFGDLLQRGLERFDQLRGQTAHESDGVDVCVQTTVLRTRTTHRGIKRGEQGVLHQLGGTGQAVRQR